jgi:uncharacterized protein (TIGR02246 family)
VDLDNHSIGEKETMRKHLTVAAGLVGATALLVGCASAPAQTTTEGDAAPTQEQIKALFADWNAALGTGDAQKVADRYAPNAVLLPTVSNQVRSTRAEIVDYFEHFLQSRPSGSILDSHVAVLDADDAIDAGTYRFALTRDGKPTTVDARYTFVYEKVDGKWLIVNHHSSAMPEQG